MDHQPSKPHPPRPTPKPVTGRSALAEARDLAIKAAAEQRAADLAPEAPKSKAPFWIFSALLIAASVAVLVLRPAWLFPPPPPPEAPGLSDASLRMVMYREAQRIESYRRTNHELPQTAVEAGGGTSGVIYHRLDANRYTLTGHNGPLQLVYSSTDSLGAFLGNSYDLIRNRYRR